MKMIDYSLPPVTHIWVTLSDFFKHFTLKRTQRMAFKKNAKGNNKLDKIVIRISYFSDFYYKMTF
jgi:hypothetical protein